MIAELGYVRLEIQDPSAWLRFGENILGFTGTTGDDHSVRLRMDAAPWRYLVEPGNLNRFGAAGWVCRNEGDYRRLVAELQRAGALNHIGSASQAKQRAAAELAFATDPSGNSFEICHGRDTDSTPFVSPIADLQFITGNMGMGHVVLPASEFDATDAFYRDLLGFGISDELTLPPFAEGGPQQRIHFLHADNPRHHSLGLYNQPVPTGVVHIMVEVDSLDNVGRCLDRAKAVRRPMMASLGRHLNDGMVSFYMIAPGGIPIEYGYDGQQFDWDQFQPTRSTQGDLWGHDFRLPG